jgi:hypothetical protein
MADALSLSPKGSLVVTIYGKKAIALYSFPFYDTILFVQPNIGGRFWDSTGMIGAFRSEPRGCVSRETRETAKCNWQTKQFCSSCLITARIHFSIACVELPGLIFSRLAI